MLASRVFSPASGGPYTASNGYLTITGSIDTSQSERCNMFSPPSKTRTYNSTQKED